MSEAAERFSLTKFIMSFFQWLPWLKTIRHLIGIGILLTIVFIVYTKFVKKPDVQETIFHGDVKEVNIIQKQKRTFIPFVEGFSGLETDSDFYAGLRAGLRFEF